MIPGSDEERWPNEPDVSNEPSEMDPLEDVGPDVPEVSVPEPPSVPDPSQNDVPDDLARRFWKLVAVFNVALFAASLGPMLAVFRGQWVTGSAVFLLGAGFFVYGYLGYRRHRNRNR